MRLCLVAASLLQASVGFAPPSSSATVHRPRLWSVREEKEVAVTEDDVAKAIESYYEQKKDAPRSAASLSPDQQATLAAAIKESVSEDAPPASPEAAQALTEELDLEAIADEGFEVGMGQMQGALSELEQERQAQAQQVVEEVTREIAGEYEKAIAKMEEHLAVVTGRYDQEQSNFEGAVRELQLAKQRQDNFQRLQTVYSVASVFIAAALAAFTYSLFVIPPS